MTKVKEEIFKLREKGYSYKKIRDKLNCSIGTISYHLGPQQKEKSNNRRKIYRLTLVSKLKHKVDSYRNRAYNGNAFSKNYTKRDEESKLMVQKIIDNPKCYLTGRDIDLEDTSSYQLDHVNPYHLTQDNSINNLGLTCKDANASKAHLTYDEYLELCKEVLINHGYKIEKLN